MLAELETELIAALRAAPFAPNLRGIDALPDLTPAIAQRIATTAPAVYVIAGDVVHGEVTQVSFDLLCFARNAASDKAARLGDTTVMGLYPLMDAVAFYFDSLPTASAIWAVSKSKLLRQSAWAAMGLSPAVVSVSTRILPDKISLDANPDAFAQFVTFHADYDLDPFSSAAEHGKWLQEPGDFSTSKPDLSDTTTL